MFHRPLLYPSVWIDTPKVLDCSVTAIPGSASLPLQVIASHTYPTYAVHTIESTDCFIGIYIGAVGSERLIGIVGGSTPTLVEMGVPKGSRVSLRNMDTAAITTGEVCCQFMGLT